MNHTHAYTLHINKHVNIYKIKLFTKNVENFPKKKTIK